MSNLQALHDFYLTTRPNSGKVQYASKFLIRLCKYFNLDTPEDITIQYFEELPAAIDSYYQNDFHKAIQDKSILAEMIGRHGPTEGWEKTLEKLLNDPDENLRQFSFQSLEYVAPNNPELILGYIARYKDSDDMIMTVVAARIMSKMYTPENREMLEEVIQKWAKDGSDEFLKELKKYTKMYQAQRAVHQRSRTSKILR